MKQLQDLILATLVYHDIFEYPLTQKEIWRFLLLSPKSKVQSPKLQFKIKKYLRQLRQKERTFKKGNFYYLPNRKKIVALRKKREKYSQGKIKIAKRIVKILQFIPWIKMIALTGALAMNNSDKDDDIDFLVITAKNRLWLTRLLLIMSLEILGRRRRPNDKIFRDKICLNMFLDEAVLRLAQNKQNLFTAHEVCQMKPIFDKDDTYEKFLQANLWVKKYLPNGIKQTENTSEVKSSDTSEVEVKKTYLLDKFEKMVYQLQLKHMESKRTNEDISPHFAFFHPKDRAKEILKEYNKKLNN